MAYRKYAFTLVVLLTTVFPAAAQQLRGLVIDSRTLEPIIGAAVTLKGDDGKVGNVITNAEGRFTLPITKTPAVVVVSFTGYFSSETDVFEVDNDEVTFELREDFNLLTGVVVTGVAQASQRKGLSFALTKIDENLIATVPALDASTTLRGKVAGLTVSQTAGNQSASVYLRGAKSISGNIAPLIVVDGFVTSLSLSDINPQDIASIEVVKGAAASALYGTRGEDGVIQVITKKGKREKISITVDNELGVSHAVNIPKTATYHHFQTDAAGEFVLNNGQRVVDYQDNGFSVNLHPYAHAYDNVNTLFGSQAYYTNTVAVSSGNEQYSLYTSFQNQSKGGIVKEIDADQRQTFTLNLGYRPIKGLETEFTAKYISDDTPSSVYSGTGMLYSTLLLEPFVNIDQRDADGNYMLMPDGTELLPTMYANSLYGYTTREYSYKTTRLMLGGKVKYKFNEHWSAEGSYSISNNTSFNDSYYPVGYKTYTVDVTLNNGAYTKSTSKNDTRNGQLQLNYNTHVGDFDLAGALKTVYEYSHSEGFSGSGYNLSAPVKSLGVTQRDTRTISSSWSQTVNYGYFLNLSAAWRDRVYLDVLGRLDRSSRFGSDVGWAFYPRASLAYRLTQDVNLGFINELKLRAAYGQAGRLPSFGAKDSRVSISSSGGVSFTQNANTNLKRAVTSETEFGFDAQLWKWLNVQFNYAFAFSKNDFINVPSFAPTLGSANIYANLGEVKSNSLELELSGRIINKKRFTWDAGLTFSRIRSEITSLGDVPEFMSGKYRRAVGFSTSTIWGNQLFTSLSQLETNADGYVTNAGDGTLRLDDYTVNKLGFVVEKAKLGTADELPVLYRNEATGNNKIIGDAEPDFVVGFNNTLSYGPLSLYFTIDWKQGGDKYDETQQYLSYVFRSSFDDECLTAGLPLAFATAVYNANITTDYWVEDASYLSLRELSLTWQLPVQKLGVSRLLKGARLSLVGRNLLTFTSFKGLNVDGQSSSGDNFGYPSYRVISGKLTLNF